MPQAAKLASYFGELRFEDVPRDVVDEAKRLLIDTLGCTIGGARTEIAPIVMAGASAFGSGEDAAVVGRCGRTGLLRAAYINGRLANAMDFDETFPVGVHFGVGAFAASLALAEREALTGQDLLLAIIVGYEIGARLATAIGPMVFVRDGMVEGYPTVWGVAAPVVLASAAASAKALRLNADTFHQALAVASSNAPLPAGSQWSSAIDLPNCKYCDAGWCTVTGLFGAISAASGTEGFPLILEDEQGMARMYGRDSSHLHHLFDGLEQQWMLRDITYKPWPTCRFTHYPMTALERLMHTHELVPAKIERVVVESSPLAISRRFTQRDPETFASRQFSYPHMIALQLLGEPAGPSWLDARWDLDPQFVALKDKVEVIEHPRARQFAHHFERNQIRQMPGGIRIWQDGREYAAETDFADGDPWDPETRFSEEALAEKFCRLVDDEDAPSILADLRRVEELPSVTPVLDGLAEVNGKREAA